MPDAAGSRINSDLDRDRIQNWRAYTRVLDPIGLDPAGSDYHDDRRYDNDQYSSQELVHRIYSIYSTYGRWFRQLWRIHNKP